MLKNDKNRGAPVTLFGIVCDAARTLGGDREVSEHLVDFLNSMSELPDVKDEDGNVITPDWNKSVYWRDLPELGVTVRHYAIYIDYEDEVDGSLDHQATPLLNATTFGATYLAHGRQPGGMEWHAEVAFMYGVEAAYPSSEQAIFVPPAATWIVIAGEQIYELCKSDHQRRDGQSGLGDEWLWGKGRGYSLERWAFWKKRFGEISLMQGLTDEVKDIAAKAAVEMGKIEGQVPSGGAER